jgi:hypothetical protein
MDAKSRREVAASLKAIETSAEVVDVLIETRTHGQSVARSRPVTLQWRATGLMDQAHLSE